MRKPLSPRTFLCRRRVAAAGAWQRAERQNAAAHDEAVRHILDQAAERRGLPEAAAR